MSTTRHRTHIDLERLTGIHERRVSVGDEDSYTLAVSAARDCLAHANRSAQSVDAVISCSITKFHDGLTHWLEPTMSGNSVAMRPNTTWRSINVDAESAAAQYDPISSMTHCGSRSWRERTGGWRADPWLGMGFTQ